MTFLNCLLAKQLLAKKCLILCLLFLPLNLSFAATEFVSVINKTGEDYNTLALWEDALDNAGDLTAADIKVFSHGGVTGSIADGDSVTGKTSSATGTLISYTSTQVLIDAISGTFQSGEQIYKTVDVDYVVSSDAGDSPIVVAEIYDDDGDLTAGVTIDGFTADATNYVKITVPAGERHSGTLNTGAQVHPSSGTAFVVSDTNVIIEWIEIDTSSGTHGVATSDYQGPVTIRNCIIKGNANTTTSTGVRGSQIKDWNILNNIIYDFTGLWASATDYNEINSGNAYIINNTVYNSRYGITAADSGGVHTKRLSNNASFNNGVQDFDSDTWSEGGYNCSSDSTADNLLPTGALVDKTDTDNFTNPSSRDFHVKDTGADIYDAGNDEGTTPSGVEVDIDGRDRDAQADTWDIGAHELVVDTDKTKIQEGIIQEGTLSKAICYSDNWYVKEEAEKCNIGRKWF